MRSFALRTLVAAIALGVPTLAVAACGGTTTTRGSPADGAASSSVEASAADGALADARVPSDERMDASPGLDATTDTSMLAYGPPDAGCYLPVTVPLTPPSAAIMEYTAHFDVSVAPLSCGLSTGYEWYTGSTLQFEWDSPGLGSVVLASGSPWTLVSITAGMPWPQGYAENVPSDTDVQITLSNTRDGTLTVVFRVDSASLTVKVTNATFGAAAASSDARVD